MAQLQQLVSKNDEQLLVMQNQYVRTSFLLFEKLLDSHTH
jgi:hypothetical protein